MRILNIMLSPGLGGIEQVFTDYHRMLSDRGAEVLSLIRPKAAIEAELKRHSLPYATAPLIADWDPLAVFRLQKRMRLFKPDIVLCHGNRALKLAARANDGNTPLVFITHNHRLQHIAKADALLTITRRLKQEAEVRGFEQSRIFHIPNSIACGNMTPPREAFHNPPVIGTLGRMVHKKGFSVLLESLAVLKERQIAFSCLIGGDGEERGALEQQASRLGLTEVRFMGWIADKDAFYRSLDLFCLPSLHEPFGIVALEAMRAGIPVTSTASEGPSEILEHEKTGVLVPVGDAQALADGLASLLAGPALAQAYAVQAQGVLRERYSQEVVGAMLFDALRHICHLSKPEILAQP